MSDPVLNSLAIILYSLSGALVWRRLLKANLTNTNYKLMLGTATGAIIIHALILYSSLYQNHTLNFALTNMVSLVAWVIAILFIIALISKPIVNLGAIILPLGATSLLAQWLWPGIHLLPAQTSSLQSTHIIVSILAYSLLSLAAVQSMVLFIQEARLHHTQAGRFIRALPPIETMETLMVQMVGIGFLLLTITVVSGVFFSEETFGQPLKLNHHIAISLLAWVTYGMFLVGRWRFGWRGRTAIQWVLGAGILLALGYFGSKFVLEIILQR